MNTKFAVVSLFLLITFALYSLFAGAVPRASANTTNVWVEYVNASTIDIYQEIPGAALASTPNKYLKWRLSKYVGGGDAWENINAAVGGIQTTVFEIDRDDFAYENGTGDGGAWVDYTIGNIVAKRRDSGSGYDSYSAYAEYIATGSYENVFLGVHHNSIVNGTIRIKINDVVSSSGDALDANGEYDMSAHGIDNVNPAWIHIASNIEAGDSIKIEVKNSGSGKRHSITGLRFSNNLGDEPGDANTYFAQTDNLTLTNSSQPIAISGEIAGETPTFMFGPAHSGNETSPTINFTVDGTSYSLDVDFNVGDVLIGENITFIGETTAQREGQSFGTLTRTYTWSSGQHTQSWSLDFTDDLNVVTAYASMWPAANSGSKPFRYLDLGNNVVSALPNGHNATLPQISTGSSRTKSFYGGESNLRLDIATDAPVSSNFVITAPAYHKTYFQASDWERQWTTGETMGGHTTTFDFEYESPDQVAWTNKTLLVPASIAINTQNDFYPFDAKGLVVKLNGSAQLGFDGFSPKYNFFTRVNNTTIGANILSPSAANPLDIAISNATASYNVFSGIHGGVSATNASLYNNAFYSSPSGATLSADSEARNNVFDDITTVFAGTGTHDFNCYTNNLEASGVDTEVLFSDAPNNTFTLLAASPCLNAGVSLGDSYRFGLAPSFLWGSSPTLRNQNLYGDGWDMGAFVSSTLRDDTAPSISTLSPADNAVDVAVDGSLVITFSEVVDTETGTISIRKASDDSTVEEFDVTTDITGSGTDEITINPTTDLPYETELYVHIDATAFDDTAGNSFAGITDATTWNFTTEDTPVCPSIANAATYNAYPTCGVATCVAGFALEGGQCVANIGASLPAGALNAPEAPSSGFGLTINADAPTTNSPLVTLSFQAGPDTTTMALSRTPDFAGAIIEPYQSTKTWNLNPSNLACADNPACTSGEYTVYARFYTQWGIVSPTVTDTISLTDTTVSPFTPCEVTAIPDQAIRYGTNNNPADVRLLEQFLNTFEGFDLVVDGVYSQADRDAVVVWQERHAEDILAPWDLTEGTGYVFRTSLAKMQEIVEAACQEPTTETPQPSPTSDYSFTRNLYLGLSGEDVRNLQRYLNAAGYVIASEGPGSPGQETDFFGSLTRAAVIEFQRDQGISPAVGYFGPVTRGVVQGG
jgi:hypothetical protein